MEKQVIWKKTGSFCKPDFGLFSVPFYCREVVVYSRLLSFNMRKQYVGIPNFYLANVMDRLMDYHIVIALLWEGSCSHFPWLTVLFEI